MRQSTARRLAERRMPLCGTTRNTEEESDSVRLTTAVRRGLRGLEKECPEILGLSCGTQMEEGLVTGVANRNRCSIMLQQNNTGERGLVRASKPQLAFAFGSRCFRPVGRVPSLFRQVSSRSAAASLFRVSRGMSSTAHPRQTRSPRPDHATNQLASSLFLLPAPRRILPLLCSGEQGSHESRLLLRAPRSLPQNRGFSCCKRRANARERRARRGSQVTCPSWPRAPSYV